MRLLPGKSMASRKLVDVGAFVLVLFRGMLVSFGQEVNWATFADKIDPTGALRASWLPEINTDFCSYEGITCESGNVTRISLPLKSLTGKIPDDPWSYLTDLQFLDLSNNNLQATIPGGLNNAKSLKEIYFQNNRLSGASLYLGNLENLETFDVSNNLLSEGVPDFGTCLSLVTVKMSTNQFTGSIPYSIGSCRKLTTLHLNDNQIAGPLPGSFLNLMNLQTVHLQNNPFLSGTLPAGLTKIKDINISNTLVLCGNGLSPPVGSSYQPGLLIFVSSIQWWVFNVTEELWPKISTDGSIYQLSCTSFIESSPPPSPPSPPPPLLPSPPPFPLLAPGTLIEGSKSSSLGTGAIAGIAGGIGFVLLVACLLFLFFRCRRRKEEDEPIDITDKEVNEGLSRPVESREIEACKASPTYGGTGGRGRSWSSGGV